MRDDDCHLVVGLNAEQRKLFRKCKGFQVNSRTKVKANVCASAGELVQRDDRGEFEV
jgi:hypothetical protein